MVAAWCSYTYIVQILLDNGADVKEKNVQGYTALMLAERKGYARLIKLLKQAEPTE